jgi:DNA invertase Pin-like site-specific DNA recombinase
MTDRRQRACLWLRVSTDSKGQDPKLQRADLEGVCQQRGWQIVQSYEVEESAYGKKPREQFQAMLEDARRGKFNILVVWSLDRFSREGEWLQRAVPGHHRPIRRVLDSALRVAGSSREHSQG